MFTNLKNYCKSIVLLTESELNLIDIYFEFKAFKKNEFLLKDGKVCNFIAFVNSGTIRHFHIKDGLEKTCDLSVHNAWVTDFQSFTHETNCIMNLQALEPTTVFYISKTNLVKLYKECNKYETFGRKMAEQVAIRATEIAMSFSSEKPEERFNSLILNQPDLFQRVPQKYIANYLGISPESLSRIRKRVLHKGKS